MLAIEHETLRVPVKAIDLVLAGHYRYYGVAENSDSLEKIHRGGGWSLDRSPLPDPNGTTAEAGDPV